MLLLWFALPCLAFFIGALPLGMLLLRVAGLSDVRESGSGNPGATNVARHHGLKWGAAVWLLDTLKGVLVVSLASLWMPTLLPVMAVAVVAGHIFSPFLRFAGGKGMATTLGVYLSALPLVGVLGLIAWLVGFRLFRRSSVGAFMALGVMALASGWRFATGALLLQISSIHSLRADTNMAWAFVGTIPLLVLAAHKDNIKRLATGQEAPLTAADKGDKSGKRGVGR
jgi:glycerol-3-phosphate acyltransferase PlsY